MAQIGTIKVETQNNRTVSVPVFDTGDSGSSVYEFVRVQTSGGAGFIPVVDPADASFPYLRVQSQNQGVVAVHNESSLLQIENYSTGFENGTLDGMYKQDSAYSNGSISVTSSLSLSGDYSAEVSYNITRGNGSTGIKYDARKFNHAEFAVRFPGNTGGSYWDLSLRLGSDSIRFDDGNEVRYYDGNVTRTATVSYSSYTWYTMTYDYYSDGTFDFYFDGSLVFDRTPSENAGTYIDSHISNSYSNPGPDFGGTEGESGTGYVDDVVINTR